MLTRGFFYWILSIHISFHHTKFIIHSMNFINTRTRKFFSYYRPYRKLLLFDLACALFVSMIALVIPLCIRSITKSLTDGVTSETLSQIYWIGAVMVGLVIIHTLCNMVVAYQGHVMGAMMERDMRGELFDHYQKLSFGFYDNQRTGQLMTRLTQDTFAMGELFHHGPEDLLISCVHFIGAFVILLTINAKLALIVFLFLPVMAIHVVYFNKKMNRALRQSRDRIGDINTQVEDSLAGIRVVHSFTNEEIERTKFAAADERLVESRRDGIYNETIFYEGLIGLTQLVTVAIVVFGGIAIVNATLDLPDLITFLLYIGLLIEPIKRFGNFARLYQEGVTGFDRFMEIMEIEPELQDAEQAVTLERVKGHVAFHKVNFAYTTGNGPVLQDLSLTINAGEYVALVGVSGVGKTTICSLIPRFYDVNQGAVTLDGTDIREITIHSLRANIGIVHQDIYLFAGTVADNIRYGKLGASESDIVAAAKQANAHDFIMTLPNGYETDIGQRGVKLSGGQKQRLSIARVFLKDPPIIIFDEATSSLDNESEKAVQESLERLTNNRTVIVIAHRLSTIRNAQRIIVMDDGGIAEQGAHDELIALNGVYANLCNTQLQIA